MAIPCVTNCLNLCDSFLCDPLEFQIVATQTGVHTFIISAPFLKCSFIEIEQTFNAGDAITMPTCGLNPMCYTVQIRQPDNTFSNCYNFSLKSKIPTQC